MGEYIDPGYQGRRHERMRVNVPARTVGPAGEQQSVVQDISESGAAIVADRTVYENDQFVELHMEGRESMNGRVVRQFEGGYAVAFEDEATKKKMADELEKFRKLAGKKDFLEG
jgi:hypothetical protein